MMKTLAPIALSIAIALTTSSAQATTSALEPVNNFKQLLKTQKSYQANGNEDFVIHRQWTDQLGKRHTHVTQTINGLNVYGTSLIIHTQVNHQNNKKSSSERIYAVSGDFARTNDSVNTKKLAANKASKKRALFKASHFGKIQGDAELAYIYLPQQKTTKLAYRIEVSWNNGGEDFGRDYFYFDAINQKLLTRHPQIYSAKTWSTHDLQNQWPALEDLPGPLVCANEQSCGDDVSAQRAHDGASIVYDYYVEKFGRIGIDDNDMPSVSSVHLGENIANAFWTGFQMIYGDGDGVYVNDLTLAPDVIGHELTHGVTQHTAGLVYANASGALNEAFSDIFGATSKAYRFNTDQPSWLLGVEALTDKFPRDAFRYMATPTKDGYSKDWWPERIPYTNEPTPDNDYGGVHGNSGIANLAFVLLTDGGEHPRGKSPIEVHKLGLDKSEQIFYRALSTYLTPSSDFAAAKAATTQAAYDLYGPIEIHAVNQAWCAVGVGAEECQIKPECDVDSWRNDVAYWGGQRARIDGLVYQAKWWTQAQDPSANNADWYVWQLAQDCLM